MVERAAVVIPARYSSNRFPGKPLAELLGEPMIRHVVRRGLGAEEVDRVFVATDDERIGEAVEDLDVTIVMPEGTFRSGSDRVAAVAESLDHEIIVNLQGDEPVFPSDALDCGIRSLRASDDAVMVSFMAPCGREEAENPDIVNVVTDDADRALYFSRSPIPYPRTEPETWWQHVGVYLYRREYLLEYADLEPSTLERTEGLEQLRVLESGEDIRMVEMEEPMVGVDRPDDLPRAEERLRGP